MMRDACGLWCGLTVAAARAAMLLRPDHLPILIFHRVLADPDPLLPGEVDVARFERLMRWVALTFEVLPLGEAVRLRLLGRLSRRALVVTFDDGYADNASRAAPVLSRLGLRATFFVASSFLEGGRMFNDTVIESIRRSPLDEVDLSSFGLGRMSLRTVDERRLAIESVLPRIKYLDLLKRELRLSELIGLLRPGPLPNDLMMSKDQVRQLHAAGMEIGGHTDRHPILRLEADDGAAHEIAEGRRRLQGIVQAPVDVFAYPNGRPAQDYDRRHRDMLASQGFLAAVNTALGLADLDSDVLQLPRFSPWQKDDRGWIMQLLMARAGYRLSEEPLAV